MPRYRRRDTVVYSLYDAFMKRTYVGSTKNPKKRKAQHKKSGKLGKGGQFRVESPRMFRRAAERLEGRKLTGYRRRTGRLPKFNITSDGLFH